MIRILRIKFTNEELAEKLSKEEIKEIKEVFNIYVKIKNYVNAQCREKRIYRGGSMIIHPYEYIKDIIINYKINTRSIKIDLKKESYPGNKHYFNGEEEVHSIEDMEERKDAINRNINFLSEIICKIKKNNYIHSLDIKKVITFLKSDFFKDNMEEAFYQYAEETNLTSDVFDLKKATTIEQSFERIKIKIKNLITKRNAFEKKTKGIITYESWKEECIYESCKESFFRIVKSREIMKRRFPGFSVYGKKIKIRYFGTTESVYLINKKSIFILAWDRYIDKKILKMKITNMRKFDNVFKRNSSEKLIKKVKERCEKFL